MKPVHEGTFPFSDDHQPQNEVSPDDPVLEAERQSFPATDLPSPPPWWSWWSG
jgi:hypothetical protein